MTTQQKPVSAPVQISVSKASGIPATEFEEFAGELPGVRKCVQVHPDETDPVLIRRYLVYAEPDQADEIIKALQGSPLVEDAERCPTRGIRLP